MTNLFLIHGAWASPMCFNYLSKMVDDEFGTRTKHLFVHNCQEETAAKIVERAKTSLDELSQTTGQKSVIVGHSLGGLIGAYLSQREDVHRTITLAAPLAGITPMNVLVNTYLAKITPIVLDIQSNSKFMNDLHNMDYQCNNIDVLVACNGYSIAQPRKQTDGILTVKSQCAWMPPNVDPVFVNANHHDILQSPEAVVAAIAAFNNDE